MSKTTSLTRQGLGITLKRSKIQNKNGTDNKISETKEDSKLEQKLITESNNLKDSIKINSEVPNVPNKHENDVKVDQKKIDILNIKKDEVENTCANNIAVDKVEAKNVSLVGDYSSSDENSE